MARRSKAISAPENFTYVEPVVNTYTNSAGQSRTIVAAGGTNASGQRVVMDARLYYPIQQGTTNTPDTSAEPYIQYIEWYDAVEDEKK